jgi:hypothetical protein
MNPLSRLIRPFFFFFFFSGDKLVMFVLAGAFALGAAAADSASTGLGMLLVNGT